MLASSVRRFRALPVHAIVLIASMGGSSALAQHNLPALNSVGRFFGVGWSHGYHSGCYDGRFQHVKDSHPASMYPSSQLLYPYSAGYSAATMTAGYATHPPLNLHPGAGAGMALSPVDQMHAAPGLRTMPSRNPSSGTLTQPKKPAEPAQPPPAWLKPYLNNSSESDSKDRKTGESVDDDAPSLEEVIPRDDSPSDRPVSKPAAESDDDDLLIPQTRLNPMQRYHQALQAPSKKR